MIQIKYYTIISLQFVLHDWQRYKPLVGGRSPAEGQSCLRHHLHQIVGLVE